MSPLTAVAIMVGVSVILGAVLLDLAVPPGFGLTSIITPVVCVAISFLLIRDYMWDVGGRKIPLPNLRGVLAGIGRRL